MMKFAKTLYCLAGMISTIAGVRSLRADTVELSFSGNSNYAGSNFPGYFDDGAGFFTAANNATTTTVPTSFALTRTDIGGTNTSIPGSFGEFNFVSSDVTSFSTTLTGGIVTALSFDTESISATVSSNGADNNDFAITGGSNGLFTYTVSDVYGTFTEGTLTAIDLDGTQVGPAAAVPLPRGWVADGALLGTIGLAGLKRRATC